MKNKPSIRLQRWADEEKDQQVSAGVLTLGDVVAAASEQEAREAKVGAVTTTTSEERADFSRLSSVPVLASSRKA